MASWFIDSKVERSLPLEQRYQAPLAMPSASDRAPPALTAPAAPVE